MKRIKIKPPYVSLTQQRLCCVACSIQWILLRRGLKLVEQETIARELDLTVPKKHKHLFVEKVKTLDRKPRTGWGTFETEEKVKKFLRHHKIPLQAKKIKHSEIDDAKKLIADSLKKGNDVVLITHMSAIDPKKKFGHALLVSEIIIDKRPKVVVGDPDFRAKKFYTVSLSKVIKGMKKDADGAERGLYVFSRRRLK